MNKSQREAASYWLSKYGEPIDGKEPATGGPLGPGRALHHAMTRTLSQNAACLPYLLRLAFAVSLEINARVPTFGSRGQKPSSTTCYRGSSMARRTDFTTSASEQGLCRTSRSPFFWRAWILWAGIFPLMRMTGISGETS